MERALTSTMSIQGRSSSTDAARPAPRSSSATLAIAVALLALLGGCQSGGEPIFDAVDPPVVWPDPPEPARIAWLGEIRTDQDLNPRRSMLESFGQAIFGKEEARSMLTPFAVARDDGDRLFVADSNAQFVHVFNLDTREYAQWGVEDEALLAQPVGLAWDPAGRLIVADSIGGELFAFDSTGLPLGPIAEEVLTKPVGVAVDRTNGRLFVVDVAAHQIVALEPDGTLVRRIGRRGTKPGEFNFPTNITIDGQGRLWVSDSLNFRVQALSTDGEPLEQFGTKGDMPGYFSHPKGLAIDDDGHLYVVDSHFESVQIFDAEGRLLLAFGQEGMGPGEFWLPSGICIDDDNRIWVADGYNRRVQVFEKLPEEGAP